MNKFDKDLVKCVLSGVSITVVIGILSLYIMCNVCHASPSTVNTIYTNASNTTKIDKLEYFEESEKAKEIIISMIDSYMHDIAPSNKLDAEKLFVLCEKYNIDIVFVMAQAQIESHFGTTGTAAKTNSVFNVGAYNGHSAATQISRGYGYRDPNDSIEPYLILLTKNYLVNGKTTNDLMNNFVNKYGKRYASNPNYERFIKAVYNKINKSTGLTSYFETYKYYKRMSK